jgi:photosystem II stability/assembly factor-like uncharacterized protein
MKRTQTLSCLMAFGILAGIASMPAPMSAQEAFNETITKVFAFRAIGPARQCGRILHVAVPENQPYTFYVAPSTGGLWKTINNGTTFESILPNQSNIPIGHIALAPSNLDIIWVGTGDPASGRIPLRGRGVFKSVDAGKNWSFMGLTETRHIGRIAIHPKNPDIVYVAAVGYHFTANPERGIYKTTDGGKTWEKILFISDQVGFVDVLINGRNPETIFAASYDKHRLQWNFEEGGPQSAIFKSTDGGRTWKKLGGGLPSGKIGRIGLAAFPKNPNIMYASVDNLNMRPATKEEADQDKRNKIEPAKERRIGGEVYRTDDGGSTWRKMNSPKDAVGGGKWYGQIYVDPNDDRVIYVPSTSINRSLDGGKTWGSSGPENIARRVHVDYHALWIDPENSKHVILGDDGGLAISYDFGKTWDVFETLPLAQYYAIGVDMEEPYNIYGGLQDNGSVRVPSNGRSGELTNDDWVSVGGGDGQYNVVDPTDSRWLYNASQNGAIRRLDQKTGLGQNIRPVRAKEMPPYRFNWTAPIVISPHNSQVIYLGAQVLLRSMNRGNSWQEISPDLTTNDPEKIKGNIEYGTLTSISESPLTPGLIWTGADDGTVQMTKNGGGSWTNVTSGLKAAGAPENYYVTRVFGSNFKESAAYVTKAGFAYDDYRPFVFKTENSGETWTPISGNLPEGTVYVIAEDRKNPNLLFVGTEVSVFATVDGGKRWTVMNTNLPDNALVHDLLIHPRENDLVVATHGRGLFVTDVSPLQEMKDKFWEEDVYLFDVEPKIQWTPRRSSLGADSSGDRVFTAPNEPSGLVINYYLKNGSQDKAMITITDPYGEEMAKLEGKSAAGMNSVIWNMMRPRLRSAAAPGPPAFGVRGFGAQFVPAGEYVVILEIAGKTLTRKTQIRKMPGLE